MRHAVGWWNVALSTICRKALPPAKLFRVRRTLRWSAAAFFLNDSCSQPLILFGTLSLLLVFFWSHTSAFFGPLNNAKLLGETLTCMLWHVRLATVLATGPHVTLCARHARVLHIYIEKEYMKVMRETVSGGGSRYFAGSRYFMTPGPKLVHVIQHQIFKEKKEKIRPPAPIPDNGCPGISIFFGLALRSHFRQNVKIWKYELSMMHAGARYMAGLTDLLWWL